MRFADMEFRGFVERHAGFVAEGFRLVPERNEYIRRSYGPVDPLGRFFSNEVGSYRSAGRFSRSEWPRGSPRPVGGATDA